MSAYEIIHTRVARGHIRHALFDFDGTLSLIREGWQQVMAPLMLEVLQETPQHEPAEAMQALVTAFIDRTTGIQTIYQMMGLADLVRERGGIPLKAAEYKAEYLARLHRHIAARLDGLRSDAIARSTYIVPGAEAFLQALSQQVTCYVASGTDVANVREEAALLGLDRWIAGGIFGALDNLEAYSKEKVIGDILSQHQLAGESLVTFGDGYVEIENTAAVGGIAVGVATNERSPGRIDTWKRERLIAAGAQVIVADFSAWPALAEYLGLFQL